LGTEQEALLRTAAWSAGPALVAAVWAVWGGPWLRWLRAGTSAARPRIAILVLIASLALATLPNLGATTLFDRDEGYYAECAREMLERGDPFVPHFGGRPFLEKPPLAFWLMAASMGLLGLHEFAARLPSALAGLAAMWLTFRLAREMFSATAGVLAAAALGTAVLFFIVMRVAFVDTLLTCCVLISMTGLWRVLTEERSGTRTARPFRTSSLALFYVGCGLGGLTKSLLGIALPVVGLLGTALWLRRRDLLWRRMRPLAGILTVLVIVGAWYVPAEVLARGEYAKDQVMRRTLGALFVPQQGHGGDTVWEYLAYLPVYLPVLLAAFFPWVGMVLPTVGNILGLGRREPRRAFLAGWFVAQLAVLSVAATKLPHYVLPLLPALSVAAGAYLDGAMGSAEGFGLRWRRAIAVSLAATFVVCGAVMAAIPLLLGFQRAWLWFLPGTGATLATAWYLSRAHVRGDVARVAATMAAGLVLSGGLFWHFGLPRLDWAKPARPLADFLQARYTPQTLAQLRLATWDVNEPSLMFYLRRPVQELIHRSEVEAFVAGDAPGVVLLYEREERRIVAAGGGRARAVWRRRLWLLGSEGAEWGTIVVLEVAGRSANAGQDVSCPARTEPSPPMGRESTSQTR
jgi:4-amino-4-deoxy-L-arabinose transferase-like glycosyltransferase